MTFEIATEKSHCPKKDWLKNITVSKQMIILLLPLCWGGRGLITKQCLRLPHHIKAFA